MPSSSDAFVVAWIPDRAALEDARCDSAPLRDLSIGSADPVDRHRRQTPLLAIAGKAQPAVAVLGCDRSARSWMRASIAKYALLDQKYGILDRGASLHLAPLNGRRMHHPD